jgi:hypothetical protein
MRLWNNGVTVPLGFNEAITVEAITVGVFTLVASVPAVVGFCWVVLSH